MHFCWRRPAPTCPHLPPPAACRSAFEGISALLRSRWPGCGVFVFGSAANALGVRDNNDIDMSMSLEGLEDSRDAKGGRLG